MTNMKTKHLLRSGLVILAGLVAGTLSFNEPAAQQASKLRIVQTNYAGDSIQIIDPSTNKVVGEIKGHEGVHGIVASPDGTRIYISSEAENAVVVIDGKTLQTSKTIPLSGNPNLIDVTPDGKFIYAAIAVSWDDLSEFPVLKPGKTGGIDVIDTTTFKNIKTINTGPIHDLYVTPDGKYVIAGTARGMRPPAHKFLVVDTKTNEVAWDLTMNPAPNPMAISKKPDGSTDKIYVQNSRDNGFQVIDFDTRRITNTVKLPEIPEQERNLHGGPSESHGMWVTPDQRSLVLISRLNSSVYKYSLPDLRLTGSTKLNGLGAGWMTITPDGRRVYVANEHSNNVSAVDLASMKEIATISTGLVPARNNYWVMP
jgi:YVTN family beta-propeller protein